MVIVNGKQVAMGRYPDAGSNLSFESFKTSPVSITDSGLGDIIKWTGAEAVINVNDWSLDRCLITGHSGDELAYTNLGSGQPPTGAGRYFFIQNDKRCLSTNNEWYHSLSESKFYIYGNPSGKSVKVSCLDYLISNNGFDYITIDGLNLSGAILFAINMPNGSSNCNVQNCSISYIGESGIRSDNASYNTYENNYLNDINRGAIYCNNSSYFKITNNSINNIGIIPGGSFRATQNDGMYLYAFNNSVVQYNSITNTGYNGIFITGSNTEIKNNFINLSCMLLNDGGGIYTSGGSYVGRVFSNNIILNSGVGNMNADLAEGIYLDEYSANVTVKNNTIANCKFAGIKNHKGYSNTITYNTAFNNGSGIFLQNSSTTANTIKNLSISNNLFIAKGGSQVALRFYSRADDIPGFGIADYNYYARPVDDDDIIYTYSPSTGTKYRYLTDWQAFTKQDVNSRKSPVLISDTSKIDFYYNATKTDKVIALATPMIDITGIKHSGSVTLQPYTSIVLFPDTDPSIPIVPVLLSSLVENATPALLVMTYSIDLANTKLSPAAFTVRVNGTVKNITSASVSGNKVNLVLAERIIYGDIITVSYLKPAIDPLQSPAGVQIDSFNAQPVRNNCSAPVNQVPVVSINSPAKGNTFVAPATLIIEVNVTDPDGTITKVELYNGAEKISEMTKGPFSFTLKDLPEGTYNLTAIATDNMKSSSTSAALEFQITKYNENSEYFNLYPNPNNGTFSIDFSTGIKADIYTLTVINIAGKTVHRENISGESGNTNFNLSHLEAGTYIIMIRSNLIVATAKFIKS